MDEIRITLPPVPTVNKLYFNCHGRRAMSSQGKKWKEEAMTWANLQRIRQHWIPTEKQKVVMEVTIYWPDHRKRDCSNILKILEDSFTGILYDDDRWVLSRIMDFSVDKENPRCEVRIYKFDEKNNG